MISIYLFLVFCWWLILMTMQRLIVLQMVIQMIPGEQIRRYTTCPTTITSTSPAFAAAGISLQKQWVYTVPKIIWASAKKEPEPFRLSRCNNILVRLWARYYIVCIRKPFLNDRINFYAEILINFGTAYCTIMRIKFRMYCNSLPMLIFLFYFKENPRQTVPLVFENLELNQFSSV